jgi:ABC-type transport system involved in multi-copper enzyme maturation permease subunit
MRTVWHSLLWKEWHEHKWKLLALVAIVVSVPLCSLYDGAGTIFMAITVTLFAYAFLSALFIGMGTAAGENASKTMPFLQALPVPMWKAAAVKLLGASITVVTPIVVVVGLAVLWYHVGSWLGHDFTRELNPTDRSPFFHLWGIEGWCASRLAGSILAALSLLVWVVASGVNRRDEIRAGAIGVLVMVSAWFLVSYVAQWEDPASRLGPWSQVTAVAAPAGPALVGGFHLVYDAQTGRHPMVPGWSLALAASASHAGLVLWFLLRFGRTPGVSRGSRRAALTTEPQTMRLAPPRRSRLTAVLWKQMRETGPFVVLGFAAIVGSTTLIFQLSEHPQPGREFGDLLLVMCAYLGFFIVIVAGIGVMLDDLKPGLHTFWRSRPINPDLWFWVKFLTGLTITAISLGIPLLLVRWFSTQSFWQRNHDPLIIILALFLSTYCFAVAAMALVRRPLYAAIFASGLLGACFATFKYLLPKSFEFDAVAVFVMAMVLSAIATLTAWLAVRYDIGYKG